MKLWINWESRSFAITPENETKDVEINPEQLEAELPKRGFHHVASFVGYSKGMPKEQYINTRDRWEAFQMVNPKTNQYRIRVLEGQLNVLKEKIRKMEMKR